jgi:rod shape-determining protein MreC
MKFFKNKLAVAIFVLSVGFLALIGLSVKRQNASFLESGVGGAINSVQGVVYRASNEVADWVSFVTHFSEIKQQNEDLKDENTSMKLKVAEYDALEKKYDLICQTAHYIDTNKKYSYKICNVTSGLSEESGGTITIDEGKNDGIKQGYAVITKDGLVGTVMDVKDTYSIVGTLNNVNIKVGAMNDRTSNSGLVSGYEDDNNNKLAIITNLLQNADIKKDDMIITYGPVYPQNIPIGKVISVGQDPSTVSTTAEIQPNVDFNKLQVVMVVIPNNGNSSEINYTK